MPKQAAAKSAARAADKHASAAVLPQKDLPRTGPEKKPAASGDGRRSGHGGSEGRNAQRAAAASKKPSTKRGCGVAADGRRFDDKCSDGKDGQSKQPKKRRGAAADGQPSAGDGPRPASHAPPAARATPRAAPAAATPRAAVDDSDSDDEVVVDSQIKENYMLSMERSTPQLFGKDMWPVDDKLRSGACFDCRVDCEAIFMAYAESTKMLLKTKRRNASSLRYGCRQCDEFKLCFPAKDVGDSISEDGARSEPAYRVSDLRVCSLYADFMLIFLVGEVVSDR